MTTYTEIKFDLPEIQGLSNKQITEHLKLYSGYVNNVNSLNSTIEKLSENEKNNKTTLSELRRRCAFEWNGMRLHELYFEALSPNHSPSKTVTDLLTRDFGSVEKWKENIFNVATMRGVGWALLAQDKKNDNLTNIWISDHEVGHLAGTKVILALDIWEHAYLIDYLPGERSDYINVFLNNIDWQIIEERLSQ